MFTKYAERYVLLSSSAGGYLGINANDHQIERQNCPDDAWIFYTHEGCHPRPLDR